MPATFSSHHRRRGTTSSAHRPLLQPHAVPPSNPYHPPHRRLGRTPIILLLSATALIGLTLHGRLQEVDFMRHLASSDNGSGFYYTSTLALTERNRMTETAQYQFEQEEEKLISSEDSGLRRVEVEPPKEEERASQPLSQPKMNEETTVLSVQVEQPSKNIPNIQRVITKGQASQQSDNSPLFTVVADTRSGSEWVMKSLDAHDSVCASQSFPTAALLPTTMPWIDDTALEKGCTLAFVRESVLALVQGAPTGEQMKQDEQPWTPARCQPDYDATNDELAVHLPRFCHIIRQLHGDFRVEAITRLFVDAFVEEDAEQQHLVTDCSCPAHTSAKGLKVMGDWLIKTDQLALNHTRVHGSKIVRLQRRNFWERYMSFTVAVQTKQWGIQNHNDKAAQMEAFGQLNYQVDIDDMLYQFSAMEAQDGQTNAWVEEHGSEILWLDYEQLRADPVAGFATVFGFLGVADDTATVQRHLQMEGVGGSSLAEFDSQALLDRIGNRGQVLEALGANGYGDFVGLSSYQPIQHIVYDTSRVRNINAYKGLNVIAIGEGQSTADQPSARFGASLPLLKGVPSDTLVVLSDNSRNPGGGLPLNPHIRSMSSFYSKLADVRSTVTSAEASHPNSVVISTSSECCGNAQDDSQVETWKDFLKDTATKRATNEGDSIYLDGSFIAGKASDMIRLVEAIVRVDAKADDRAALLNYMQQNPDSIVLDYEHKVFGNKFDGVPSKRGDCESKGVTDAALFVHPSRQDQSCHNRVQSDVGIQHFPQWEESGIAVQPILDHIERFTIEDISMGGIERHFGKEIFYVVDSNGVWRTADGVRDKYRVKPTEKFLTAVHKELMLTSHNSAMSTRWSALQRTIQSSGFMYYSWYGDWKTCQSGEQNLVPLFTTCAVKGCGHSFPMPNYMSIIESQPDTKHWYDVFARFDRNYPWESKTRQVVWRGGLSENDPTKVFDSPRWRLCKKVHEMSDPAEKDLFNVGLTNIPVFLTSQIDIDESLIGGLVPGIGSMLDFQQYTAVLDMDGNSWSSRFSTLLCFNQVTIKVEPMYPDYFFHDLVPWKHYVPVKYDLSDLVENVAFVLDPKNDDLMQEIAASANQWCAERLTPVELARDMLDMLESYTQLLDRADPNWEQTWANKKSELFAPSSKVAFMKLDENEDISE